MEVLITGSTGFIGKELCSFLGSQGISFGRLLRVGTPSSSRKDLFWDIEKRMIDSSRLEGIDAVIHLAGENIAEGRWTESKKQRLRDSRVLGTHFLTKTLAKLKKPPKIFISASAIGYYGDRGPEICTESTPNGAGFLASVCREWEAALRPVQEMGIRTVILRNGIVLSPHGGVLQKMRLPFLLGLGGILGSGKQYMSWVDMQDLLAIVLLALQNEKLDGVLNLVAPHPVTNAEFTQALAKALRRPAFLPVPTPILRLVFGREKADELL